MSDVAAGGVVRVAPREIGDLVTRAARVSGADPADAGALAARCVADAVSGGSSVADVIAGFGRGEVVAVAEVSASAADHARAAREGIPLARETLVELERAAAGFLVSEAEVDAALEG